jgi:hypothetical protein
VRKQHSAKQNIKKCGGEHIGINGKGIESRKGDDVESDRRRCEVFIFKTD